MKDKDYNIEIVRFLSFIMVIVIHVANYYCRAFETVGSGEYIFALILNTVSRVSVPCFFMISGALLLGRNETMAKSGRRVVRFLTTLIVWSLIYYGFNTYYMNQTVEIKKILEAPAEAHLWYLYVMIPVYLVLPFLQAMCRGMNAKLEMAFVIIGSVWVIVLHLISYVHVEFYYDIPILGNRVYIYYLFIGYFLAKQKERIPKNKWLWFSFFVGCSVINIIATALCSVQEGEHFERFLEYGCPLVLVSAISFFVLMMQMRNGEIKLKQSVRKLIDVGCSCSFGIYLIHIIFLDIFKKHVKPYEISAFVAIPVLVVGISLVSFGFIYIIRRFSVGRKVT